MGSSLAANEIEQLERTFTEAQEKLATVQHRARIADQQLRTAQETLEQLTQERHQARVAAELDGEQYDHRLDRLVEEATALVSGRTERRETCRSAQEFQERLVSDLYGEMESRRHERYACEAAPLYAKLNRQMLDMIATAGEVIDANLKHRADAYWQAEMSWEPDPENKAGLNWLRATWMSWTSQVLAMAWFGRYRCDLAFEKWRMRKAD